MNIIGDVSGRFCILIDDIVDSAGTLCNAAAALKDFSNPQQVFVPVHGPSLRSKVVCFARTGFPRDVPTGGKLGVSWR